MDLNELEKSEEEYGATESLSDFAGEKDDEQVLEDAKKKNKQSKQGFKSLVSRKRVSNWDMDEIFLM